MALLQTNYQFLLDCKKLQIQGTLDNLILDEKRSNFNSTANRQQIMVSQYAREIKENNFQQNKNKSINRPPASTVFAEMNAFLKNNQLAEAEQLMQGFRQQAVGYTNKHVLTFNLGKICALQGDLLKSTFYCESLLKETGDGSDYYTYQFLLLLISQDRHQEAFHVANRHMEGSGEKHKVQSIFIFLLGKMMAHDPQGILKIVNKTFNGRNICLRNYFNLAQLLKNISPEVSLEMFQNLSSLGNTGELQKLRIMAKINILEIHENYLVKNNSGNLSKAKRKQISNQCTSIFNEIQPILQNHPKFTNTKKQIQALLNIQNVHKDQQGLRLSSNLSAGPQSINSVDDQKQSKKLFGSIKKIKNQAQQNTSDKKGQNQKRLKFLLQKQKQLEKFFGRVKLQKEGNCFSVKLKDQSIKNQSKKQTPKVCFSNEKQNFEKAFEERKKNTNLQHQNKQVENILKNYVEQWLSPHQTNQPILKNLENIKKFVLGLDNERETQKQTEKEAEKQTEKEAEKQTEKEAEKQTEKEAEKQTETEKEKLESETRINLITSSKRNINLQSFSPRSSNAFRVKNNSSRKPSQKLNLSESKNQDDFSNEIQDLLKPITLQVQSKIDEEEKTVINQPKEESLAVQKLQASAKLLRFQKEQTQQIIGQVDTTKQSPKKENKQIQKKQSEKIHNGSSKNLTKKQSEKNIGSNAQIKMAGKTKNMDMKKKFMQLLREGEILEQKNRRQEAHDHYVLMYKKYKADQQKQILLIKIAQNYENMNLLQQAQKTYMKCTKLNNTEAFFNLGSLQIKNNKIQEGIENLQKANCIDRNNIKIEIKLVYAYSLLEATTDRALALANSILKRNPQCIEALIMTSKILQKKGKLRQALDIALAIGDACGSSSTYHYIGLLYLNDSNVREAFRYFQKAIEVQANHTPSLIEIATILSETNPDQSISILKNALVMEPQNQLAFARLGKIYETFQNNYQAALQVYKKGLETVPSYENFLKIGDCYLKMGSLGQSHLNYKYALEIKKTSEIYQKIAEVHEMQQQYKKSVEAYSHALAELPKDQSNFVKRKEYLFQLGKISLMIQEFQAAQGYLLEVAEMQETFEILKMLGKACFGKGSFNEALRYYEQAASMQNEDNLELLECMAMCFDKQEDYLTSKQIYEKIISIDPKNIRCINNLANIFLILGKTNEAFYWFEFMLQQAPTSIDKRLRVIDIYATLGDWSKVEQHLAICYKQKENDIRVIQRMVNLYKEKRDMKQLNKFQKRLALIKVSNNKN